MKHAADLRTVLFLVFIFIFQTSLFFIDFSAAPVLIAAPVVIVNSLLVFIVSLINHNQRHLPIFNSAFLNHVVDLSVSLMMGSPAARLSTIHEINHHDEFQKGDDWSRYSNAKGKGLWRLLTYCMATSWRFANNRRHLALTKDAKQELLIQRISVLVFFAIFIYFRPALFFFVFAPSWLLGLYFLLAGNLLTHDGCDLESDWNHSRNFLSRVENWFLFNHGFHTAHHVDEQTHWSELPHLHKKQCAGKIDERFETNSYFYYLLRNYTLFL